LEGCIATKNNGIKEHDDENYGNLSYNIEGNDNLQR
jgi:hypothetical protein